MTFKLPSRRQAPRPLLLSLLALGLYGCTDTGCDTGGEGGGCDGVYAFPQVELEAGSQPVADSARLRVSQSALTFLEGNIKEVITAGLGAGGNPDYPDYVTSVSEPDPANPTELVAGLQLAVWETDEAPSGYDVYPTTTIIDPTYLEDNLTLRFVDAGEMVSIDGDNYTVNRDGILLEITELPVGMDARVFRDNPIYGDYACDLYGQNPDYCPPENPNCGIMTGVGLAAVIVPAVTTGDTCDVPDTECLSLEVDIVYTKLINFSADGVVMEKAPRCDVSNPPDDCSYTCSDQILFEASDLECSTYCSVTDFTADIGLGIADIMEPLLENVLDDFLEDALKDALADIDGMPMAIGGRFPMTLGGLAPGAGDLGFSTLPLGQTFDVNCPTGDCAVSKGMAVDLGSGAEAAPDLTGDVATPHPCVNTISATEFAELYGTSEFESIGTAPLTGVLSDGTTPYDIGASISSPMINQVLYGMYNAGGFCIEVSTDDIHKLTDGGFELSVGTLDLLTEGKLRKFADPGAPVVVSVVPHTPPVIAYGAGTEEEGHILADWDNVEIAFYVLMYERFARVFSVAVDISVALSVTHDEETQKLVISIVDGPTVENFEERYNELLPEVEFSEVLESLIGVMFDAALGGGLDFDFDIGSVIADALDAPVYIDFQGLETLPAGDPEFLQVYLSLTDVPPPDPMMEMRTASARFAPARMPGVLRFTEHPTLPGVRVPSATGSLTLVLDEGTVRGGDGVYVQTDFGPLRGPLSVAGDGTLLVEDGKLRLEGKHTVRTFLKRVGSDRLEPLDPVSVWVDATRPTVRLERDGEQVIALGHDTGARGNLTYSWQLDDSAWTRFGTETALPVTTLEGAKTVRVKAKDPAGNESFAAALNLR